MNRPFNRTLKSAPLVLLTLLLYACAGGNGSTSNSSSSANDSSTSPDPISAPSSCDCAPLTDTIGETINVSTVTELNAAISTVNSGGGNYTILLADGTYELTTPLYISVNQVMLRSNSGNRNSVLLTGQGMDGSITHIFQVMGSDITIADLSIGEVANHAIQVHGENGADNLLVHNVRIFNTNEQMLKGSYSSSTSDSGSDNGTVECSLFEYTDDFGPQYYIGGIDVHQGANWTVRNNEFRNIRSPESSIAEHAIHFWSDSKNPLIEQNLIINCDRGIGLGLGQGRGCSGGEISNNMIYSDGQGAHNDVGIGLEDADNIEIYHNTIYFDSSYPNAIEYRYSGSNGITIINNLTNKAITSRDGGSATVADNVTSAEEAWFTDVATGDLHLASAVTGVVDAGQDLSVVTTDYDCESRTLDAGADIGADEYQTP